MKRAATIFIALLALSALLMVVIVAFLPKAQDSHGGFVREFNESLVAIDTINLGFDSYYIAGQTPHTLFLGNLVAPRHIISVNIHTGDTNHIALNIYNPKKIAFRDIKCRVDSPRFFLTDGTVPCIFQGSLTDRVARQVTMRIPYFVDMEPLQNDGFAFRSLAADGIAKLSYVSSTEAFVTNVLTKQVDGVFCTSGIMSYDNQRHQLVYVHFYRNDVLILDSCLRSSATIYSIDTVSRAKISIGSTSDGSFSTFASPPVLVNRQSSTFDGVLVINSKILDDNEAALTLKESSDFDFYQIASGDYLGTFHIPNFMTEEAKFHRLFTSRLAVLYKTHLLVYRISIPEHRDKALHVNRN
jgi:hypothetical protein